MKTHFLIKYKILFLDFFFFFTSKTSTEMQRTCLSGLHTLIVISNALSVLDICCLTSQYGYSFKLANHYPMRRAYSVVVVQCGP